MSDKNHCQRPARRWRNLLLAGVFFAACAASAASDERQAAFESGLGPAVQVQGSPEIRWTLASRMAHYKVPAVSIAVIRNGEIAWAAGYGLRQATSKEQVDTETLFSVGSLSKVGTAAMLLRLVDRGELDLDRDVNDYLHGWQVPANRFTAIRPVTLRGILSHSAGLTVSGFPDYAPGEPLPDTIEVLAGRSPAKTGPVLVDYVPGSRWRYSGGGTTVAQLLIEELTGGSFDDAARRLLFEPLGMSRSSYRNPLPAGSRNVARAHGPDGKPRALPRGWESMPEAAASGLWTTPSDYARLVIALIESYRAKADSFLEPGTAGQMMTEVGVSHFGLGPMMSGRGTTRVFSHSGANNSYRAWMQVNLATGNGAVIFTNGANGSPLRDEVRRALADAEGWHSGATVRVPAVAMGPGERQQFTGVYVLDPPTTIAAARLMTADVAYEVFARDGYLHLKSTGSDEATRLVAQDVAAFVDAVSGARTVEFIRGYNGEIGSLRIHEDGKIVEATKAR